MSDLCQPEDFAYLDGIGDECNERPKGNNTGNDIRNIENENKNETIQQESENIISNVNVNVHENIDINANTNANQNENEHTIHNASVITTQQYNTTVKNKTTKNNKAVKASSSNGKMKVTNVMIDSSTYLSNDNDHYNEIPSTNSSNNNNNNNNNNAYNDNDDQTHHVFNHANLNACTDNDENYAATHQMDAHNGTETTPTAAWKKGQFTEEEV